MHRSMVVREGEQALRRMNQTRKQHTVFIISVEIESRCEIDQTETPPIPTVFGVCHGTARTQRPKSGVTANPEGEIVHVCNAGIFDAVTGPEFSATLAKFEARTRHQTMTQTFRRYAIALSSGARSMIRKIMRTELSILVAGALT